MRWGRVLAGVALCLLAAAGLSACESSQSKSAKLAKLAKRSATLSTVKAGAANPDVKVTATTLLTNKDGAKAVVVALADSGASQAAVPIQIVAKDAAGKALYKNDIQGLQASLQQMAFVAKAQRSYWVHDQIVAVTPPKRITVQVGKATAPAPTAVPDIRLENTHLDNGDTSGLVATGTVKNFSKIPQRNLPIYAVATRGGKVVAAGRAIVELLNPEPQKKPTIFRIFFVGNPKGAQLDVHAVPSTFTGAP
jgi:hypothetical protein